MHAQHAQQARHAHARHAPRTCAQVMYKDGWMADVIAAHCDAGGEAYYTIKITADSPWETGSQGKQAAERKQ